MTLTYRGTPYTPSPSTIEAPKVPRFGTYRGQSFCFTAPQPANPVAEELTYRGIPYGTRSGETVNTSSPSIPLRRKGQRPVFSG